MYLENVTKNNKEFMKLAKSGGTFAASQTYWTNILFERTMRLFVWNGPDKDGVPQKEIESSLMIGGMCGITNKYKKKLAAFNGYFAGTPTVYYDHFEDFSVHSPVYSAVLKVGKQVAIIENNSVRNSIMPLVNKYASLLAHCDVTLINVLINMRDKTIPVASTASEKTALENYRNSLCNGKVVPILDPAFSMAKFVTVPNTDNSQLKDLMETRRDLLNAFYNDIGVKTSWNKKGNMISEEVQANDSMLLLNLNDMLAARQKGCEMVNEMYGTKWTVDISPELKYNEIEKEDKEDEESKPVDSMETE